MKRIRQIRWRNDHDALVCLKEVFIAFFVFTSIVTPLPTPSAAYCGRPLPLPANPTLNNAPPGPACG